MPWLVETNQTHDGMAVQNADNGFNPASLQTTIQGPAAVSFWWKETLGTFNCSVGTSQVAAITANVPFWIDPPTDWLAQTIYLPAGPQTVTWTHTPVQASPFIPGAGFLDQVSVDSVGTPPLISSQPQDESSLPGFLAQFSVTAGGTPPLTYQWQFNGTFLPGATNSTLTLTNLQAADFGSYQVIVSNQFATNLSSSAALVSGPLVAWGRADKGQIYVPASSSQPIAVAAGRYHGLALRQDGSISAWGDQEAGQTVVPSGLSSVAAIAAGDWQSIALKNDGTVVGWGKFVRIFQGTIEVQNDLANAPAGLTNIIAVAAGTSYAAALNANGTINVWGRYDNGRGAWPFFPSTINVSNAVAIAGGANHILALLSDSTVVSVGEQTDVPAGLSNVVAVAAGAFHSLALMSDGTVVGWGDSGNGEAVVPDGLSNVVAISAAGYDSLAVKSNGTVATWGLNDYQQLVIHGRLTNVAAVACGGDHSVALVGSDYPRPFLQTSLIDREAGVGGRTHFYATATGAWPLAYQWQRFGTNLPGATGPILSFPYVQSADAGDYTIVVTNSFGSITSSIARLTVFDFSAALNTSNIAWQVGSDVPWFVQSAVSLNGIAAAQSGPIGTNQTSTLETSLMGPGVITFAWKVSSTQNHDILFVNVNGQTQAAISGQVDWTQQTLYLGSGPQLVQWIYAKDDSLTSGLDAGWLAQVTYTPGAVAPRITKQPASVGSAPGLSASFSVTAVGSPPLTYQWRLDTTNIPGATDSSLVLTNLGSADFGTYSVVVSNFVNRSVSAEAFLRMAEVVAWGQNSYGQTQVPWDLTNVAALAGGWHHSVTLKLDGTVTAWGANNVGQTNVPPGLTNVIAIASRSGDHSMALKADGTVVVWGDNTYGQTNVPATVTNVIAISAGGYSCVALKGDGTAICWGNFHSPPAGLSNVVAISAGDYGNLFLKSDGTLAATGISVPSGLSNLVAIAMGGLHNLALHSDGTVVAWGDNVYGQINIPPGLNQVVAIAAGDYHSTALRADGTVVTWGKYYTGSTFVPAQAAAGRLKVVAIAAGSDHDLAFFGNAYVPVPLVLGNPTLTPGAFTVTVPTQSGHVYRLEYLAPFTPGPWTAFPLVAGKRPVQTLSDTGGLTGARLYRVGTW